MNRLPLVAALTLCSCPLWADLRVERVMERPQFARADINIRQTRPIDDAHWVWHPDFPDDRQGFYRFRRDFALDKPAAITVDVSADERFCLTCDGEFVGRGPNRGTVDNWAYQTYALSLGPGVHRLEAVVWRLGDAAPIAQLSYRGGFILKARGEFDELLTTGKAKWKVGRLAGTKVYSGGDYNGVWGSGAAFECVGTGFLDERPDLWEDVTSVKKGSGTTWGAMGGRRDGGWMLYPVELPDQTEKRVAPGRFKALAKDAAWRGEHVYTEAETKGETLDALNALLKDGKPCTIPAKTRFQAAWDLGVYNTAYPELILKGGKGARVSLCWTESSRNGDGPRKGRKGDRNAIVGKYLEGYGDVFVADGREKAVFTTPWFRCGKWCRLDVETGDEPLTLNGLALVESHYPIDPVAAFASPDDPSLADIRRISLRAMEMCSHEMFFDCPYYEQQMYPGDTRVEMEVMRSLTADDRLIRRAIEIFDLASRDDGMVPMNFPTRGTQESLTYTLCYLCMYGDYAMNNANREWLKARLPGLRRTMSGCEMYENDEGFLVEAPGWSFIDWVNGWVYGTAPGSAHGEGPNAEINLFWILAMQSAAKAERALGNEFQAQHWEAKIGRLAPRLVAKFWDEKRGLLADSAERKNFSEHAQALAIVAGVLDEAKASRAFEGLEKDPDLLRCSVYFSYYLFEAYFRRGRGDLFLKKLDLWRGYVKTGVTTLLEEPDEPKESRSDCHAWGAHPIIFMQRGLAGIRSSAPFFGRVAIAPAPGALKSLTATHPHPQGVIKVELKFEGGKAKGFVETPVPGEFAYGGEKIALKPGRNEIK